MNTQRQGYRKLKERVVVCVRGKNAQRIKLDFKERRCICLAQLKEEECEISEGIGRGGEGNRREELIEAQQKKEETQLSLCDLSQRKCPMEGMSQENKFKGMGQVEKKNWANMGCYWEGGKKNRERSVRS
jgi:hypothetical protein